MLSKLLYVLLDIEDPNYKIPDRNVPKEDQRKWLVELCLKYIEEYVTESSDVDSLVKQVEEMEIQDTFTQLMCRFNGCERKYIIHSARVK